MELRYPAGFRSVVDADLGLRGSLDDPTLSGTVTVRARRAAAHGRHRRGPGRNWPARGRRAAPARRRRRRPAASFPLRFDVRLTAPSTLEIDNKLARLTASADLRLRGHVRQARAGGPRRSGPRRGLVRRAAVRRVSRGTVDFSNPLEDRAVLRRGGGNTRPRAGADLPDHAARDRHDGELEWELSSDPPLPEVDILSLLLGDVQLDPGRRAARAQAPEHRRAEPARASQLGAAARQPNLESNVQKAVEQTFGLDSLQITPFFVDPNQQTARFSPGARLTIGKRISDRVYLTYSRSLTSAVPATRSSCSSTIRAIGCPGS